MTKELGHEDVARILKLVDETSRLEELDVRYGDFRLHVRRSGSGAGAAALDAPAPAAPAPDVKDLPSPPSSTPASVDKDRPVPEGMVAIRAPMLGTFYRAPAPGEKPFVEEGQVVGPDDTVCIIEVMKLFHSVRAGVAGWIAEIRAQNATLVEHGEVLIVVGLSK